MSLFQLPPPPHKPPRLSPEQRRAIDVLTILDGKPLHGSGHRIGTGLLRTLIKKRLVMVISLSPARYRVTGWGRHVRNL